MIFNFIVEKTLGESLTWTYDNITNSIRDETGKLLTKYKTNNVKVISSYRKLPFKPKVEISLGLNCNYNCKYCSQKIVRNKGHNAKIEDIPNFISLLKNFEKETNGGFNKFQFWGGEPLVYWKVIEKLVPELRKNFGYVTIDMATNGSLLDEEKLEFCKKYKVGMYVSDDGNNCNRIDNADNPIKNNDKIYSKFIDALGSKFCFNCAPGNKNPDIIEIHNTLLKRCPNTVKLRTANVMRSIQTLGDKELDRLMISMTDENLVKLYQSRVLDLMKYFNFNSAENVKIIEIMNFVKDNCLELMACGIPFGSQIVVDLLGNVYKCHCRTIPEEAVGNLKDLDSIDMTGLATMPKDRKYCSKCPVVALCMGNCPNSNDDEYEVGCFNRYASYYGYLQFAMRSIYGVRLLRVENADGSTPFHPQELLNSIKIPSDPDFL